MAGYIHGKFPAAPGTEFVEAAARVILDDLLRSAGDPADFAVRHAFPGQGRDLNFFRSEVLPGVMIVPRCCFAVRGVMFN